MDKSTLIAHFKYVVSEMLKGAIVVEVGTFGVAIYNHGRWIMSIFYKELLKDTTESGLERLLTERIYDDVFR